jgi:opacity protein-like surface antigen
LLRWIVVERLNATDHCRWSRSTICCFHCSSLQEKKMIRKTPSRLLLQIAAVGFACIATASQAQSPTFYVAGDVGASRYKASSEDFRIVGGTFDQRDTAGGIAFGFQLNPTIALELGYTDFGRAKVSGLGSLVCRPLPVCLPPAGPVNGDLRAKSTHVTMVATAPLTKEFSIYGRLGAARTERATSVSLLGSQFNFKDNKTEALFGLGAAYAFTSSVEGTIEWKRLQEPKVDAVSVGARFRF